MSVLVNLGYGSITDGWDTGNAPDVPTPFGLFPTDINPTDVFNALAQGIPEGFSRQWRTFELGSGRITRRCRV